MRLRLFISIAFMSTVMTANAFAEDAHREADAHEHGHGQVNIAIEGNQIDIELEAPGSDIVGFEHEAETDNQKKKLTSAKAKLAEVLVLIKIDGDAGCRVTKADVAFETDGHSEEAHGKHDDHTKGHDDDHDNEHDAKSDPDSETGHAEFHGLYQVTCKDALKITGLTFDYFKAFASAQELDVNVVTAKKQTKFEVTRDKPAISLVGMM